jgi:hypothetical protein
MISRFISAVFAGACLIAAAAPANAASDDSSDSYAIHRKKPGGYSYDKSDSVNTYGSPTRRTRPPGPPDFRDQTISGPFDNGFFFDSGVGSIYGGNSPYMH